MSSKHTPISLHPDNPRYFLYDDKPLVLITATEHYGAVINRNFNYEAYLDDMVDKQHTLSRCFLLFREMQVFDGSTLVPINPHSPCKPLAGEFVSPFARTGNGFATDGYPKFDLDTWNPEYFERLHGFLQAGEERGIIIELTLFSSTYSDAVWRLNPLNIQNNVNGVGDIPWQDYVSMRDKVLFDRQLSYVRKIVQEVNPYKNIYLEICNEPFTTRAGFTAQKGFASKEEVQAWQRKIRETIREEEARLSNKHLIFQVPLEFWRTDTALEEILAEDNVDAINMHDYQNLTYKDIPLTSLSRFMQRDLRLRRINHFWTSVHGTAKPFIFDEDNSATNALDEEAWTVHRKRAWATVCSGGHYNMIDFSVQVGGQEAGTPASQAMIRSWLKYLSSFTHSLDFISMKPLVNFASETPKSTIAITLAKEAEEYILYLADEREVDDAALGEPCAGKLSLNLPEGSYTVKFFSPVEGVYLENETHAAGGELSLELKPFIHDIVIQIKKTAI